jgi:aminoglycoside phosphotransferase (APT) family kinase protein
MSRLTLRDFSGRCDGSTRAARRPPAVVGRWPREMTRCAVPAADLMVAWWLLTAETRPQFRAALAVDEASWTRGLGWALSCALIALPYYRDTNPPFASYARRAIAEVLSEPG